MRLRGANNLATFYPPPASVLSLTFLFLLFFPAVATLPKEGEGDVIPTYARERRKSTSSPKKEKEEGRRSK